MRTLRVLGAAIASLVCAATLSSPGVSVAAPPAAGSAYQLGTYDIKMNTDCATGTVTMSGWDSRATQGDISVTSRDAASAPVKMSAGSGTITAGAANIPIMRVDAAVQPVSDLGYVLVVSNPTTREIIATHTGRVHCEAAGSSVTPLTPTVVTSSDCKTGRVAASVTLPASMQAQTAPSKIAAGIRTAADTPLRDPAALTPVSVTGTTAALFTFDNNKVGEYLIDVVAAYPTGVRVFTTAAVDVVTCPAGTAPGQNTNNNGLNPTPTPAPQSPVPAPGGNPSAPAGRPGLANSGGHA